MNVDRIKEIQQTTAYPDSRSVQQALLKVWNECEQEQLRIHDVISAVCTCENAETEKESLVPVFCLKCNGYCAN